MPFYFLKNMPEGHLESPYALLYTGWLSSLAMAKHVWECLISLHPFTLRLIPILILPGVGSALTLNNRSSAETLFNSRPDKLSRTCYEKEKN
jgi:hypothetical protein